MERKNQQIREGIISTLIDLMPHYSVKLSRGQRGTYGWEIKVSGDDKSKILDDLIKFDTSLRSIYEGENGKNNNA